MEKYFSAERQAPSLGVCFKRTDPENKVWIPILLMRLDSKMVIVPWCFKAVTFVYFTVLKNNIKKYNKRFILHVSTVSVANTKWNCELHSRSEWRWFCCVGCGWQIPDSFNPVETLKKAPSLLTLVTTKVFIATATLVNCIKVSIPASRL